MSKAIRSYPETERRKVISRRLSQSVKGLGYISAVQADLKEKAKSIKQGGK